MGATSWVAFQRAAWLLSVVALTLCAIAPARPLGPGPGEGGGPAKIAAATSTPPNGAVANFTAALDRLVDLVGLAGSAILTLVWARVALSWFSNDLAKKIQAKDRARDALIGTLLFVAAVSGLVWGLAHWVVTGT